MNKHLCLFLVALMIFSSCDRIIGESSNSTVEQTSSDIFFEEPFPDVETRRKVDFDTVKEDLVGVYGCHVDFSPYTYEYIFWEDEEYLVFDWQTGKTFTKENSSIEYFIAIGPVLPDNYKGEAIIISLTHMDSSKYELYLYVSEADGKVGYGICPSDKLILLGKIDPVAVLDDWIERFSYFSIDEFDDVQIGVTTYNELFKMLSKTYPITITSKGHIAQFPIEEGKYIRVTFNTDLIITSLEDTKEFVEPFTLGSTYSHSTGDGSKPLKKNDF